MTKIKIYVIFLKNLQKMGKIFIIIMKIAIITNPLYFKNNKYNEKLIYLLQIKMDTKFIIFQSVICVNFSQDIKIIFFLIKLND